MKLLRSCVIMKALLYQWNDDLEEQFFPFCESCLCNVTWCELMTSLKVRPPICFLFLDLPYLGPKLLGNWIIPPYYFVCVFLCTYFYLCTSRNKFYFLEF